jgi:protein O-GlcNAcase / histone acetyltransferase
MHSVPLATTGEAVMGRSKSGGSTFRWQPPLTTVTLARCEHGGQRLDGGRGRNMPDRMDAESSRDFLAGVIEGFYGQPWSQAERRQLFDWMAAWGLNTYLYAPKDDLKHRVLWRELYSDVEAARLRELIGACHERSIRFVHALSPGLDLRYSNTSDIERLHQRFRQLHSLGAAHFALLFDDIPDRLDRADLERWGSLASAQAHVANTLFEWTRQRSSNARFLFCPTPYCQRMADRLHGGPGYLQTIGRELVPAIDILWTGPEIVSPEITVDHLTDVTRLLRRQPVIWDNLHANDYDGRRFFCGPYAGRPPELRHAVHGLLTNPNCEFPLNYVPIRTLARFVQHEGPWDPRAVYLDALREWLPRFDVVGPPVTLDELVLLADCFYLPHAEGPKAEALLRAIQALLRAGSQPSTEDRAAFQRLARPLGELCARLTSLRDRKLFHALNRRLWDLREELDLLNRFIEWQARPDHERARSDFHLPGTYRGGMIARLQRLLEQQPDGSFIPAAATGVQTPATAGTGPCHNP